MNNVKVRFAPSPSGDLHLGNARTALFNYLYAKHNGGKFFLRIEDTDVSKQIKSGDLDSVDVACCVQGILDDLAWLGIQNDGDKVYQSMRNDKYNFSVSHLLHKDYAYKKDGAIWLRMIYTPVSFTDALRGDVTRDDNKDFVIVRSDGSYGFHLTNVVDDIDMGITHVIRGDDHLSNTAKHIMLYRALGIDTDDIPTFCHLPLVLKAPGTGKGKMSKSDNGIKISDFRSDGYDPRAIVNYISLLGWNPKTENDMLSMDDLIDKFDFKGLNKNGARFDPMKLASFNKKWKRRS
jgi:glutamyl-tRNA synthetase